MTTQTTPKIDLDQRTETIQWCLDNEMAPLPVAPFFPGEDYPVIRTDKKSGAKCCVLDIAGKFGKPYGALPLFTGKNPSYLESNGKPKIIRHSQYQSKNPTQEETNLWFNHPSTGVGVSECHWR